MIDQQQLLTRSRSLVVASRELVVAGQHAQDAARQAVARAHDILERSEAAAGRRARDGADRQQRREETVGVSA